MFAWLLAAVVLGHLRRPAWQGRTVAYLTVASFVVPGDRVGPGAAAGNAARRKKGGKEFGSRKSEVGSRQHHRFSELRIPHSAFRIRRSVAMNVQVVGCSHHGTSIAIRERLAFGREQTGEALDHWRRVFRQTSRRCCCRRATGSRSTRPARRPRCRPREQVAGFLARFHKLDPAEVAAALVSLRRRRRPCGTCSRWPPAWTAWWWASRKSWPR